MARSYAAGATVAVLAGVHGGRISLELLKQMDQQMLSCGDQAVKKAAEEMKSPVC